MLAGCYRKITARNRREHCWLEKEGARSALQLRVRAMIPAEGREQLAIDLELTADWRRSKALQDPDEPRNAEAAALLDNLAVSVRQIDDETIDCCASRWDGAREAELWSQMKRQVGFDRWPENAAEFVAEFIATTSG